MAGTPQNTKIPNLRGTSIAVDLLQKHHRNSCFYNRVLMPKIQITISNNYKKSKGKNIKKVLGSKVLGSSLEVSD
jgi:hypothetical protein